MGLCYLCKGEEAVYSDGVCSTCAGKFPLRNEEPPTSITGALISLVKGRPLVVAPDQTEFKSKHYEFVFGIDDDHHATLIIDKDSLEALKELTETPDCFLL